MHLRSLYSLWATPDLTLGCAPFCIQWCYSSSRETTPHRVLSSWVNIASLLTATGWNLGYQLKSSWLQSYLTTHFASSAYWWCNLKKQPVKSDHTVHLSLHWKQQCSSPVSQHRFSFTPYSLQAEASPIYHHGLGKRERKRKIHSR